MHPRILVAGVGNIFLGDDGFGCEVIRVVQQRDGLSADVRVFDYGIGGVHLAYDLLDGCETLVLVDALPGGGTPGAVRVFEADLQGLPATGGLEVHSVDPVAVMATLRMLGGTPPRTIVVGCQVKELGEGIGLSDEVRAAVPAAADAVRSVLSMLEDDNAATGRS